MAVAFRLWSSHFISAAARQSPPLDWGDQVVALKMASMILHQGVFGLLVSHPLSIANWLVVALWLIFVVVSLVRDPFNVVVWLVALVTLSPRMAFGLRTVTADRYYFEVMFLVVLFVAIVARRAVPNSPDASPRIARAAVAVAWLGVSLSAWSSWQSYRRLLDTPRYAYLPFVRTYTSNLRTDLSEIRRTHAGTLEFAEGSVPRRVLGMAALSIGPYSKFLMIFDSAIRVSARDGCRYVVQANGKIARPPAGCKSP